MRRVLIIGAGGIGKRHIRGFLATGRARLSVVEPDEEKLARAVQDYPLERAYRKLSEVELSAFDAAVICTPAHLHVSLGQACANAGVPFLTEKPLSVSMQGVERLIQSVQQKNLPARVGYVRRASPETVAFREQILNGRIGQVRMCYVNASQDYPRYRPDFQRIYYASREMGGGAILDAASHMFDLLMWMMGPVSEVSAMYDCLQLPTREVEDAALISLRFASGCMAQININQFQKPNVCTVEMIGTEGNLVLDMGKLKFASDDSGRWEVTDCLAGMDPLAAHEARFRYQADMFLGALDGRPDHLTTLPEARENLRVALAAKRSYRLKRIIRL